MAEARILNFGSLNLDYVYQVDHFAAAGETISAKSQTVKAGGKGLNQSIALARAGAAVWHAGCVGKGGEGLRALLRENGVRDTYLLDVDALQGNAVIQVSSAGENCIVLFGGSNRCVTEAQIDETLADFSPGDWLILQNEVSRVGRIVEAGAGKGMRMVLNPSPYDDALRDVDFSRLAWILVNEIEMEQLTGCREPERAFAQIHAAYPKLSVLITLGSAGSMAWQVDQGCVTHAICPAFPVRVMDTTAAGDTYTGYFIAGLMEKRPLADCMRRASKAASIAVTLPGAAESIPKAEQLEDGPGVPGRSVNAAGSY